MASEGFRVFCYSIAPFIVYRCLEQFRNDVCFHRMPVCIVGNGGGYGYGIMGSSHHAIEDLACLSGLPNVTCRIPAFNGDVEPAIDAFLSDRTPCYLRLGMGKPAPWHITGKSFNTIVSAQQAKGTIIALGPVVNNVLSALQREGMHEKFTLHTLTKLPFDHDELIEILTGCNNLLIAEEHVATGGIGESISRFIHENGIRLNQFISLCAKGYPSGQYGSQNFHQQQSGLDTENIREVLKQLLREKSEALP
jgi:transketolase